MKILLKTGNIEKLDTEVLVIPVFKGIKHMEDNFTRLDRRLNDVLSAVLQDKEQIADEFRFHFVFTQEKIRARKVLLAGLGENDKADAEKIRKFGGKLCQFLRNYGVTDFTVFSLGYGLKNISIENATQALAEGLLLGNYQFTEYKTRKDKQKMFTSISIFPINEGEEKQIQAGIMHANTVCESVCLVRDIVNRPPNIINPASFALLARKIAKSARLRCKVMDVNQLKKEKMGCILGIGNGSVEKPRMVVLEYKTNSRNPMYALVGKGVTFDSGGLSLKQAKFMEEMKDDKAGASTVLGAMHAIARLKLPVNIIGVLPLIENMPSGTATKPGDILVSANGKTVEVLNTDAEGRLILADALHYATKQKPAAIIDLATLTGACIIALGYNIAGIFGTDQQLVDELKKAGDTVYERVWQLPLAEEFSEDIKSSVADIKNIGGDDVYNAGACTAAAFLKEFVGDIPWAHIDIAGPAWSKKDNSYLSRGATGFGVRLLVEFFLQMRDG